MDRKSQLLANLSTNLAQYGLSLVTNFLLISLMIRRLGLDTNGLWVLLTSVAEYFSLLDIGLSTAFLKHLSEAAGRKDRESGAGLYHFSLFFYRLAAAGALALGLLAVWGLPRLFHITPAQLTLARWTLGWLALDAALSLFLSSGRIVLQSLHRYDRINLGLSLKWLLRFAVFILLLELDWGLDALAAANFSINALIWAVLAVQGARLFRGSIGYPGPLPPISATLKTSLFRYSSWIVLAVVANRFFYYVDTLVLGVFRTSVEITFYFAAWKLVEIVRGVVQALLPFVIPLASEMEAGNEREKIPVLYFQGMRLTVLFSYPLIAYLLVLGDRVLGVWAGPEFISYYALIPILLLPQIGIFTFTPSSVIAYGINRHRPWIIYSLTVSVLNLLLSVILVRPMGLWGVAWGTSITLVACLFFNFYFHPWLIGFSRRTYFAILFRALVLLAAAILYLAGLRLLVTSPPLSLLLAFSVCPLFAGGYYLFEFTQEEKATIRAFVRQFVASRPYLAALLGGRTKDQTK